jgi:hypothetical protein
MWMVDPKMMCRQHLLGEHVELHMFCGTLKKKGSIDGFIQNQLLEPNSIAKRHEELVKEMEARGMNHKSPIEVPDLSYLPQNQKEFVVNKETSKAELLRRCQNCKHI